MNNKNIKSFFDYVFLGVIFFPFVGSPSFDTQPFPIVFSLIYIFYNYKLIEHTRDVNVYFFWGIYIICFVATILLTDEFSFLLIRGMASYIGVPSFLIASSIFLRKNRLNFGVVFYINIIWIIGGVLQLFIPDIFSSFVSMRTSSNRGVTSFAPEPGFYSMVLVYITFLQILLRGSASRNYLYGAIILNIVSVLILAKSFLGLVYLVILVGAYFFSEEGGLPLVKSVYLMLAGLVVGFLYFSFLSDSDPDSESRINFIVKNIFSNPLDILVDDESAASRISDVILPPFVSAFDFFIPHGFDQFSIISREFYIQNNFSYILYVGNNIIKSWHGAFLFEMGYGYFSFVGYFLYTTLKFGIKAKWQTAFMFLMLFSSVPVAFPLVYFGIMLFWFVQYECQIKT